MVVEGSTGGRAAPSNRALKLLEKTRASRNDWSPAHYHRLLTGFGFVPRQGSKHTVYVDPSDSENFVIVPRHARIRSYIAADAIEAIEKAWPTSGEE